MINRSLIRIKVLQLMYAYYQNGDRNPVSAEKELLLSLSKAYDLYNYLLVLMVDVTRVAREQVEHQEEVNRIAHLEGEVSHRFVDNRFVAQLEINRQLNEFRKEKKLSWYPDKKDYLVKLLSKIQESDVYKEYMSAEEDSYKADQVAWRLIYKHVIIPDEDIDEILEDESLFWNDDREIVDTFVIKTIKQFREEKGADQQLLEEFKDESDREFAMRLLTRTITNATYYRSLISENAKNWEYNRMAFIDTLLMQIAIAEILSFPEIPVRVTINEYVELAKLYSTPKSGKYINGLLDHIARRLHSEGKMMKSIEIKK